MYKTTELFDLEHTIAKDLLSSHEYPWETLKLIKEEILKLAEQLDKNEYKEIKENVWVHNSAKIADSAFIEGPTIIGKDTEIRHCAYIRGSAIVGEGCVIGNSCELKNAIIFDGCQVPHFNYVGDSILGYKAHMGAGSIVSNIKSDKHNVVIKDEEENYETNLRKFGAMIGDYVEVGCNSVLNPGTIIGRDSNVYPTSCVRGTIPEKSIWKNNGKIIAKHD